MSFEKKSLFRFVDEKEGHLLIIKFVWEIQCEKLLWVGNFRIVLFAMKNILSLIKV